MQVQPPKPETLRVLYLTANPEAVETTIQHASDPSDRVRHDIALEQGTHLSSILSRREMTVNSSHHQAIKNVGEGFRVTAYAPDGIVEGLEDPNHPFYLGVQWHPEDMSGDPSASKLFGALVEAARKYAAQREASDLSPAGVTASE